MKKSVLVFTALALVITMAGQTGKTTTKPATKTPPKTATKPAVKPAGTGMKNILDSASYAIGMSVANFYKQQGVTNINTAMVSKGCDDIMKGLKPAFDDNTANNIMTTLMNMLQANKSQQTIKEGEAFLAANKLKQTVKVTATGLQYEILRDTTGPKPTSLDTFVVNYRGTLLNGMEFDNSYNRGQPLTYPMNKVVPGWTEGLQLMSIGSKYKFYIPYQLGYGIYGNEPTIPGGSMLIFEIEMLDIKKYKAPGGQ
jgi:FKBP-type peptidyl-prolyl cis-trans isomerase